MTSCIFFSLFIFLYSFLARSVSVGYSISPIDCCSIFCNLLSLAEKTTIWPHPEELFIGGCKIEVYDTLRVASLSMGIPTPLLVMAGDIENDEGFLRNLGEGKFKGVLKRDYSMKGEHVITPSTEDPVRQLKKLMKEQEHTWKLVEEIFGTPHWFIQPFVAHLVHVGEVRAFVVEGRMLFKVTTTPRESGIWATDAEPIRPLHTHV